MCCTEIPTSLLLSFNVSLDGVTVFLRAGVTVFLIAGVTVFLIAGVTVFITVFLRAGGSVWRNTCTTTLKMSLSVHGAVPRGATICSHAPGVFGFYGCFYRRRFPLLLAFSVSPPN